LLAVITLLGGFLRFYWIGSQGLWLDEAFSVWMGRQPIGEMLSWLVRIDQHPPFYYLLLHFWMALGDDASTVRVLSALLGTLVIPVIYLLGRRLADWKVGLLAALILAVSPFHVRFAQEARMYALLALNASLALYALVRLLTDPRAAELPLGQQVVESWRSWHITHCRPALWTIETDLAWLGYVFFTVATMLTHNTAIFFPVATNLFVASLLLVQVSGFRCVQPDTLNLKLETRFLRNWLLAQAGVLLLWSPWLPAFIRQTAGVYREFWLPAPTWGTVVGVVGSFTSEFLSLPPLGMAAVSVLFTGLVLLGLVYFRRRPAHILLLLMVFLAPFIGEWLISLWRPIFYDRTLIWASLPLYLLLAAGVCQLRRWPHVLAVVLMVLAVNTLSLRQYYGHFEKEQWDDAAAFVAQRAVPDDLILFNATWVQIPFDYYFYRLYNRPVAEHGVPVDLFDRGVLEPKMDQGDLPRLRALIQGRGRVWLVYSHHWYTDPEGLIPSALEEELDLLDVWEFYGLQVSLYGR
jgi:mannosyltransferase